MTLRSESVNMERRPVARPATDADRPFRDRTIEAEPYSEQAVVEDLRGSVVGVCKPVADRKI